MSALGESGLDEAERPAPEHALRRVRRIVADDALDVASVARTMVEIQSVACDESSRPDIERLLRDDRAERDALDDAAAEGRLPIAVRAPAARQAGDERREGASPMWVDAIAIVAAISGPVMLLSSRRSHSPFLDLDTAAVLAGVLLLSAAVWMVLIEPRRVTHPRLAESPGFAFFAAVLGYLAVGLIVWRVIDDEGGYVSLPVVLGALMALAGAVLQTMAGISVRRIRAAAVAAADPEQHANAARALFAGLDRLDDRLYIDAARVFADEPSATREPRRRAAVAGVRALYLAGEFDDELALEALRRGLF
ncbi:hypothetical protein SAMN05443544_1955 [Agromyces cerinus subsp. cerinus]|uniref:Uncharacterized protein n=1 Tax=Agromyces cerinus subsp. cerinus TaxID=232089 RepID=A0A1N6FDH7_9MICO|nr:hypothetical protein SAMN05443544_1955 [Agromyces cerinus subsp. cerinus]